MIRRLMIAWALSICIVQGQPAGEENARSFGMPRWIRLGGEVRGRAESSNAFDQSPSDSFYLNRLRLNVDLQPRPWLRFVLQGQDARVFGANDAEPLRNTLEARQAYALIGNAEEGWQVRVGRQELAVGDERLVGADNYWDSFGLAFDAIRVGYSGSKFQATAFTGLRVEPARRRVDPFDTASRLSGLTVQVKTRGDGIVEPYALWKRGGDTLDLMQHPGHRDVVTPGIRATGSLPRGTDYNIEMALQRGHVVDDRISAWAGHWELGWKPLGTDFGMRVGLEYNFASGDKNCSDGHYETFDDLYPAGFNKFGMSDPIAWRNIRYPAVGVEMPVAKRWTVYGGYRYFQLASAKDGIYPGGDHFLVRNLSTDSTHVGSHVLISTGYTHSDRWRIYGGYGYLLPGDYLQQSGYPGMLRTAYVQSSFTF